jgi:copper chaperone CopZ
MRPFRTSLLLFIPLLACEQRREKTPKAPPTPLVEQMPPVDPSKTVEGTLLVAGMTCSGCEYNVTTALKLVPGVLEAEADHVSGETHVRFDPGMTTLAHLAEAVRTTGYVVAPTEKGD